MYKLLAYILGCVACVSLLAGCGQKAPTETTAIPPLQNVLVDREADFVGTAAGLGDIKMHLNVTSAVGSYTLGNNKPMEVSGMVDEDATNTILLSDFNELDERPNIYDFNLFQDGPGHFTGIMKNKQTGKEYRLTLSEVNNNLPEQIAFGGHYTRDTSGFVDILFLDHNHVQIQGLAAYPALANIDVSSPNIWPISFVAPFEQKKDVGKIVFDDGDCSIHFDLTPDHVAIIGPTAKNAPGCGAGANTSFNGIFNRATTTIPNWNILESNR